MNKTNPVKAPRGRPRKRWQRLGAGLCLLGTLAFATPLAGGVFELSNSAAMAFFLCLGAAIWWWEGFTKFLARLWKPLWGKIFLLISGFGLAAVVLLLLILSLLVAGKLRARPQTEGGTLVVLGCQVKGDRPSLLLGFRIEAAADWLAAHPEAKVIVSGGQGGGENITEAECMYRALCEAGVAPERILLEDQSRTTLENLEFSARILRREGLPGPAILVSSDFHIYRALQMAGDLGLEAEALAARSNWFSKPTYILREAMALVKYFFTK